MIAFSCHLWNCKKFSFPKVPPVNVFLVYKMDYFVCCFFSQVYLAVYPDYGVWLCTLLPVCPRRPAGHYRDKGKLLILSEALGDLANNAIFLILKIISSQYRAITSFVCRSFATAADWSFTEVPSFSFKFPLCMVYSCPHLSCSWLLIETDKTCLVLHPID